MNQENMVKLIIAAIAYYIGTQRGEDAQNEKTLKMLKRSKSFSKSGMKFKKVKG